MNAILKRMFEDDDCSKEEANLKAAILGKTYDECKVEWSRQFKKEFILANINLVCQFNQVPDNDGKINFMLALQYFSMSEQPCKNIIRCDNVTFDANFPMNQYYQQNKYFVQYPQLTIAFYASELDDDFIEDVTNRIYRARVR